MTSFFTAFSLLSFLACMALGILYAWVLYRKPWPLSVWQIRTLSVLRAAAVTLISWLLFAPLIRQVSYTPEKPIIVIANDNSLSVGRIKPAGFDEKAFEQDLKQLREQLAATYEVRTYSFSDSIKNGLDFSAQGKLSNGANLIGKLKDEFMNRNLGAVIMASDGIFNRGGNPLYDLKQLHVPVYTIALGDTIPRKDVLIADVSYNDLVYLDNTFTFDIQVEAYQSQGETTQITIEENGKKIKEEALKIDGNRFVKNVQLRLKANKTGIQQYRISLSGLTHEVSAENNVQTVFVEVIDGRKKILLLSAAPHPDLAALKQAMMMNAHYEVVVALPDEQEALNFADYSLAILYQFPDQIADVKGITARLKAAKLPLWYILGAQTDVARFNAFQSFVKISRANGNIQEVFPLAAPDFTLFTLEAAVPEAYDPLLIPFGNLAINGSYTTLLQQKIGRINTDSPLLFFMTKDEVKAGFLLGEGLWKWKLEEAKHPEKPSFVNELVTKTIQYLSVSNDKRKFKVNSNKAGFHENEQVILNATLYNNSYEPVNDPDVSVLIKADNGKTFNYMFSKQGTAYRLAAGPLPQGNYTYTAGTVLGENQYTATGSFYVSAVTAEYQQTTANHQLLYSMAAQNNGKMVMPGQLQEIAEALKNHEQVKTIRYEDRTYEELINLKWLFAVIILLLTAEWFLRKRNGEI